MKGVAALSVILYSAALLLVILLLRLLWRPLKFLLTLLLNSAIGCALILLINSLLAHTGVQIAINAITASICAVLGVSGVGFLAVFNFFF